MMISHDYTRKDQNQQLTVQQQTHQLQTHQLQTCQRTDVIIIYVKMERRVSVSGWLSIIVNVRRGILALSVKQVQSNSNGRFHMSI